MAYDYDYMTWIYNPVYNEAKRKDELSSQARYSADRKVTDAKQRLSYVENELYNQTALDRQELDRKLAQERQRLLNGLDGLEESIRADISRQNASIRSEMNAVRADIGRVNARAEQVGQKLDDLATQFNNTINSILSRVEDQKTRAIAYSNQLGVLIEQIRDLYAEKLTPDEYVPLSEKLPFVETNIKNGDYEAAIGLAQDNIPTAMALRARLEILNDEFSQLVVELHERCAAMHNRIQEMRVPEKNKQQLSFKEDMVEFDGNIPFWSNGVFDTISERFEQLCSDTATVYEPNMDIDTLKRTLDEVIRLEGSLDACISFAQREYLEYVSVYDLAVRLHEILERCGWYLCSQGVGFVDDDIRQSYSLLYEDGCGMELSVVVMPVRDVTRDNKGRTVNYSETRFSFDVFCERGKDAAAVARESVRSSLEEAGIDLGNSKTRATSSDSVEQFVTAAVAAGEKVRTQRARDVKTSIGL